MKMIPSILARLTLLIGFAGSIVAQPPFKPPEIAVASDVPFPVSSVASGIVVIDVSLDAKGEVTGNNAPRLIPSLTSVAISAVQDWKYSPASLQGIPQASLIRVAFAFRPRAVMVAPPSFTPLPQQDEPTSDPVTGYLPPGILAVAYPAYPIDAATVGTVVVQVRVNADGSVEAPKAIRPFPPFTRFSLDAAKKWQFRPATLNGKPVASKIGIAFVYSAPPGSY